MRSGAISNAGSRVRFSAKAAAVDPLAEYRVNVLGTDLGTYLLADDDGVSTPDLIRGIAHASEKPARLLSFPPALLKPAGAMTGEADSAARMFDSLQVDCNKIGASSAGDRAGRGAGSGRNCAMVSSASSIATHPVDSRHRKCRARTPSAGAGGQHRNHRRAGPLAGRRPRTRSPYSTLAAHNPDPETRRYRNHCRRRCRMALCRSRDAATANCRAGASDRYFPAR